VSRRVSLSTANLAIFTALAAVLDGVDRRVATHLVRDLGMCCGGSMDVFVEYVAPPGAEDRV
jgi:xanthine/CO dehydrogenase XdhC/CoxF family maturation factor